MMAVETEIVTSRLDVTMSSTRHGEFVEMFEKKSDTGGDRGKCTRLIDR